VRSPHLRVAWHPDAVGASALAEAVFRAFHLDPARPLEPSLGLPVAFGWRGEGSAGGPIAAHHTPGDRDLPVLVLLVDDLMVAEPEEAFKGAPGGLEGLLDRWVGRPGCLLLPVALSEHAFRLDPKISAVNFVRLADLPVKGEARAARLISRLTHELAREVLGDGGSPGRGLRPAPISLFLSHAKEDGDGVAGDLLDYLARNSPVKAFYDSSGIAPGEDFAARLDLEVRRSVFVAIHSDAWPSRPWCRWEANRAREADLPFLVVEAGEEGGEESYSYPGAAPRIRWRGPSSCPEVVDAAIRVALRWELCRARLTAKAEALGGRRVLVVPHRPDLVDGLRAMRQGGEGLPLLLHPDPPLQALDRAHFKRHLPDLELRSAGEGEGEGEGQEQTLKLRVQVSVSEPEEATLLAQGASLLHVKAVQIAVARALLQRGASIAYGGDLRPDGFTLLLFNLVEASNRQSGGEGLAPIEAFVGWPQAIGNDRKAWAAFARTAIRHVMPQPEDPLIDLHELSPKGEKIDARKGDPERYAWSRGSSEMRQALAGIRSPPGKPLPEAQALVALGGKVGGFFGTVPGVLEEIVLSCRARKPVFLCAGFGGATALAAALLGLPSPVSRDEAWARLRRIDIEQASTHAWAGPEHPLPSAEALGEELVARGGASAALGTHLSEAQQAELATTTDPDTIVRLVLTGLAPVPQGAPT